MVPEPDQTVKGLSTFEVTQLVHQKGTGQEEDPPTEEHEQFTSHGWWFSP